MSSNASSGQVVDTARATLCRQFSEFLKEGASHVRVRLHRKGDAVDEAWFYAHHANQWKKQGAGVTQADLMAALEQDLEMLASRGKRDGLTIRKAVASDATDYDFQFQPDLAQAHPHVSLETTLLGILFRDAHASGGDVRRSIRTPHQGA
jgi:hypothetical protein